MGADTTLDPSSVFMCCFCLQEKSTFELILGAFKTLSPVSLSRYRYFIAEFVCQTYLELF